MKTHIKSVQVFCIIAWAGLAACRSAPYYAGGRGGSNVDTEAIVNKVMGSLNLNEAIAEAMRGLSGSGSSFTGTLTTRPQVTVKTSGSRLGENSLSRFSGVSTQGGSSFALQSGLGGGRSGARPDKTAVVGQVLNVLSPQIEKAVADALRALSSTTSTQQASSFGSSNQQSSSLGTSNQQSSFSSGSNQIRGSSGQDESGLVSQIISMLTPTITQSVQSAISGQSSSVDQQSFMSSLSQTSGLSSGSSFGAQQSVTSTGLDQNTLAQQVLTALAPTITSQVQAAITSMQSSSSSSSSQSNRQAFQQSQAVQVSEQETSRLA